MTPPPLPLTSTPQPPTETTSATPVKASGADAATTPATAKQRKVAFCQEGTTGEKEEEETETKKEDGKNAGMQ